MFEVTVKTLDSQNHSVSVSDDSTVREFKQQIAPSLGIDADKQRLIFCGRVLQDDKKLQEYNVDGKVIHLVQRPPPQAQSVRNTAAGNNGATSTSSGGPSAGTTGRPDRDGSSFLLGAFSIPREAFDPNHVQNVVQNVVSGMGEWGRNATVMSRTSEDGSSVDVHINLGVTPLQSEAQARLSQTQVMLTRASSLLQVLENVSNRSEDTSETEQPNPVSADNGDEIESEEQSNSSQSAAMGSADVPLLTQFCSRTSTDEFQFVEESDSSASTDRSPFGYRIAQAARAAVAAAVTAAAAAGAAEAAARATTSTTVSSQNSPDQEDPVDSSERSSTVDPQTTSSHSESVQNSQSSHVRADSTPVRNGSVERPASDNSTNATNSNPATPSRQSQQRGSTQPSVNALVPLWDEVMALNNRLQPHLQRCMEQIRSDAPLTRGQVHEAQNMFDWISKILHYLSHAYHNLSDLYVNFNQTMPRTLRVRIVPSGASPAFIHSGTVPVQAQVNISSANSSSTENPVTLTSTVPTSTSSSVNPSTEAQTRTTSTESTSVPTRTTSSYSGGSNSVPLMFNSSQSPFVFMEVGPGTITIDSISATLVDTHRGNVVTSATSSTSTTNPVTTSVGTSSRSVPTSTTAAAAAGNQQPHSTSDSQFDGPRLLGYGGLPSFLGGNGGGNLPLRGFNSVNFPANNLSGLRSFDPNLPCNSIWALDSPMRRRHHAGASNQPSSSVHVGMSSNTQGRQTDILHNVISGLVNTVLTEATNVSGSRPITASASIPGFAVFASSASPDDGPGHSQNQSRSAETQNENAATNNVESRSPGQSHSEDSSRNINSNSNESMPFTDDVFTSLIQGLQLSMSDQERVTVAEFLSRLEGSAYVEGQSIFSDLFMCIARESTFQDLASIFFGHTAPLTRMRPAIQQFVREKVLRNEEYTPESLIRARDEIIEHGRPILEFILAEANLRSNIDYVATYNKFCRMNIESIIESVLNPPEDESFGSFMFRRCRQLMTEFIAMNVFCFSDGTDSAERLTQMRIAALTQGMNPMIRHWIQTNAIREINQNVAHINYPLELILQYIVYKDVATSPDSPPAPEVTQNASVELNSLPSDTSPMSTESGPEQSVPATDDTEVIVSSSLSSGDKNLSENSVQENVATPSSGISSNGSTLAIPTEEYPDVVIGSESWHNSVPRDWVPIIARDVHRQRRQAPQAPFSDAYLGGMPSKRRKVMTNGTSPSSLLAPVPSVVSESLQQAIVSAGVQPRTSIEQIKREASQDTSLQTAYKEQVKCAIQERLRNDMDYSPERFPNAEQCFNKETQ